ncbi:type II secretion system major pseudopilin GspG [Hyphomicrobium sp. 99]|uniref:type II secretion system major pseudopilin GspG n=1 Tax=Hyphomicrobium sp. 99 TaxID=1163419 RepID=UPI0005F7D6AF|nr:type II secretion system major pseudopilin GspG [Hyphomicrobium sp. 99]
MKISARFSKGKAANAAINKNAKADAGFTLLELLVVLGIIALLATVVAPQVLHYLGKARTETSKAQISAISTALELYALDNGTFPSQQAGLNALVQAPPRAGNWKGPYLKKAQGLIDPWGRPYQYRFPGPGGGPEVYTLGRDNSAGGTGEDQDVSN